ncbi:PspA/IM30 family protein [uncultured Desulfosarcina sp.]|uniref:PspA/IM30 family protein n=1 Tax=uncultured Desulfosarcina sp. TaxID=218289 RepID=UPI0029C67BDF|nr:PspA/IM30 family protein [uncultured Desulfosarcina sp.]
MGIMTRMVRLCKADVHGVMDQLEDKGLLLKQYLREMETSLGHKEQQVNALTRRIGRLTGQIARHAEEVDKLERDLTLALQKEKDDIARMLIRRRRALETAAGHLKEQIDAMSLEKTQLTETLSHQRLQYETLNAKADACCFQATDHLFETASDRNAGIVYSTEPVDEEIELELLTRKDALQKGGTP